MENEEIAEKIDKLMFYHRENNNFRKASACSKASSNLRQLDEKVEDMTENSEPVH